VALFVFGCDESLPPREEPENVIDAKLQIDSRIHVVRLDSLGVVADLTQASASYRVTSNHDEVLSDSADVFCEVEIWVHEFPSYTVTLTGGALNLVGRVQVFSGILYLEPGGQPAHVQMHWNHWGNGQGVWTLPFVSLTERTNLNGEKYLESQRIWFRAKASGRLWKNMPEEDAPEIHFWHVYRIFGGPD
jgi:hypothetical protein